MTTKECAVEDYGDDSGLGGSNLSLEPPPPALPRDTPEAENFRETPLYRDDRPDDEETDSREGSVVFDLFTSGHGFIVRSLIPPTANRSFYCERCGTRIIRPADSWVCECSGCGVWRLHSGCSHDGACALVVQRPAFPQGGVCRCNACEWNTDTQTGRPPKWCGPCWDELERERAATNRAAKNARDRMAARDVILADRTVSDEDIAEMLGIRPIRVKEARLTISTGNPV